jgi:hypothetical protein
MNGLVCGANAETIETTGDVLSLVCPRCGEYDVLRSVIAAGQLRQLEPKQRRDILVSVSKLLESRESVGIQVR